MEEELRKYPREIVDKAREMMLKDLENDPNLRKKLDRACSEIVLERIHKRNDTMLFNDVINHLLKQKDMQNLIRIWTESLHKEDDKKGLDFLKK